MSVVLLIELRFGETNSVNLSPTAFWDATRAFMLLSVLSCFAGVVLGLSAFANGTKNRRVRTGGIALLLSGGLLHTH